MSILKSTLKWIATHPTGVALAAILGLEVADLSIDLFGYGSATSTGDIHVDNVNVNVDDSWSLVNASDNYAGPLDGREITNAHQMDLSQFNGKTKEEIVAMLSSTETV